MVGISDAALGDLCLGPRLADNLEKLAFTVGLDIQRNDANAASAASRTVGYLQACANSGELGVEEVRVHECKDTIAAGQVRSSSQTLVFTDKFVSEQKMSTSVLNQGM